MKLFCCRRADEVFKKLKPCTSGFDFSHSRWQAHHSS